MVLGLLLAQVLLAPAAEPPLQHLFVPGTLGFTSYRATVLVATPTHLVAFTTGRCSDTPACRGDISSRSVVVRTREQQIGGSGGSLEPLGLFLNPLGLLPYSYAPPHRLYGVF